MNIEHIFISKRTQNQKSLYYLISLLTSGKGKTIGRRDWEDWGEELSRKGKCKRFLKEGETIKYLDYIVDIQLYAFFKTHRTIHHRECFIAYKL